MNTGCLWRRCDVLQSTGDSTVYQLGALQLGFRSCTTLQTCSALASGASVHAFQATGSLAAHLTQQIPQTCGLAGIVRLAHLQEGFLSALVQTSARSMAPGQQELQYKNVADAVEATACLDFLEDIVPQQVTVATYLKSAQQQQAQQQQAKT